MVLEAEGKVGYAKSTYYMKVMQESYQVDPIRNFFDCFDAIYCVNLERRSDRWEKVMLEFAKIGISDLVVRHKAIETPDNGHI